MASVCLDVEAGSTCRAASGAASMAAIEACMARMVAYNRGSAKSHSGIWRDLAVRKRPTDVAAQLAPVRAAARRHGVPTPLADKLVELITGIEQGRLEQGGALGDALGALARPL